MNIRVENIKCSGCANSITKKLTSAFNTKNIKVDVEQGLITIDVDKSKKAQVIKVLLDIGYPQTDSVQGFDFIKTKAKSFVSCAIGRMDNDS